MSSSNGRTKQYRSREEASQRSSVLYVQVRPELHQQMKELAKHRGITISQLVEEILEMQNGR